MIRVVLDSNVYISALISKTGNPRKILRLANKGVFITFISKAILSEIRGVLRTKFKYPQGKLELFEELISETATLVDPKGKIRVIKSDPDDNRILECALDSKAHFVVSGDNHLLDLKKYKGIKILNPSNFLSVFSL